MRSISRTSGVPRSGAGSHFLTNGSRRLRVGSKRLVTGSSLLMAGSSLLWSGCGQSLDGFFFSPAPLDHYELSDAVIPAVDQEQVSFLSDEYALAGFFAHNPDGARADTTILYSHGNAQNIEHYWDRVELLWSMGYQVFIYDYRGYGMSEGSPTEEGLYADIRAALTYLQSRDEVYPDRIVYYGYSLGSCAATDLAAKVPPAALITEAAFASGEKLVQDSSQMTLAGSFLFAGEWDTEGKIQKVSVPKLLIHGTADDYVNISHLDVLEAVAPPPVEVWRVEGANHSDIPEVAGQEYPERVTTFLDSVLY